MLLERLKWIYRAWRYRYRLEPREIGEFDPEIHQRDVGDPGYVHNFLFLAADRVPR